MTPTEEALRQEPFQSFSFDTFRLNDVVTSLYISFTKLFKDILSQREREDGDNNGEFDDAEVSK